MQIFFTLAGIVAVGVVVGYLVTPLIFYLMEVTAYAIVLLVNVRIMKRYTRQQLRRFPKLKDLPESMSRPHPSHSSDSRKQRVKYPQPIHNNPPCVVGGDNIAVVNGEHKANNSNEGKYRPANNDSLNMVKCPTIEKVSKGIHNLLSFYSRFYGQSTKVEKNLLVHMISDTSSFLLFC